MGRLIAFEYCVLVYEARRAGRIGISAREGRPQLGDTPVFSRLWLKGGMLHRVLPFSRDSETAIFQRFTIFVLSRSVCEPAPTGEIRPFLAVGAGMANRTVLPDSVRKVLMGLFELGNVPSPSAGKPGKVHYPSRYD